MATKKKSNKERASVGRERRLALCLRALVDAYADVKVADDSEQQAAIEEAEMTAETALTELGYATLESIPSRIARIYKEIDAAREAGDGAQLARLGVELERAKAGKPELKKAEKTGE